MNSDGKGLGILRVNDGGDIVERECRNRWHNKKIECAMIAKGTIVTPALEPVYTVAGVGAAWV